MKPFNALRKRLNRMLAHIEHMRLVERMRSALWRLPERWVKIDSDGNEQVVYETPNQVQDSALALLGIASTVHPKEYIITDGPDGWNPDMDGIDDRPAEPATTTVEFTEWSDHPEGLPPAIPTD